MKSPDIRSTDVLRTIGLWEAEETRARKSLAASRGGTRMRRSDYERGWQHAMNEVRALVKQLAAAKE